MGKGRSRATTDSGRPRQRTPRWLQNQNKLSKGANRKARARNVSMGTTDITKAKRRQDAKEKGQKSKSRKPCKECGSRARRNKKINTEVVSYCAKCGNECERRARKGWTPSKRK